MKNKKSQNFLLGELIVALFEEADKVSSVASVQKVMVYAALKDLMKKRLRSRHPIVFRP